MANNSLRSYTAGEVLDLLESQQLCDEQIAYDIHLPISDDESDGCEESIGGYIAEDGTEQQVEPVYLCPLSTSTIFEAQGSPLPSERDSMLLLDVDVNDSVSDNQEQSQGNQEYISQISMDYQVIDETDNSDFTMMDYQGSDDRSAANKDGSFDITCNSVLGMQIILADNHLN